MDPKGKAPVIGESVTLRSDNGAEISFFGRLFSESSFFDESTSILTRLRLFVTDKDILVYSILFGAGTNKARRFYTVEVNHNMCEMCDGVQTITLPVEMLFTAVFGLCGIDPARAEEFRPIFEENLRAVNS